MNDAPITVGRQSLFALSLAAGGLCFALYQVLRPFTDTLATMASPSWLISHLLAIAGFTLVATGLLALPRVTRTPHTRRWAGVAVVLTVLGTGLTLPYYGAETFALWLVARFEERTGQPVVTAFAADFHSDPVAVTSFAVGLVLLGLGALAAAAALREGTHTHRASGVPFALGFALLIPQFFTPQPVRMVHGVLVALGCVWLAVAIWRAGRPDDARTAHPTQPGAV